MSTTIAGHHFELTATDIVRVAAALDPEPVDVHFAVVNGRRFPPKQLIEAATGLDRADFNTHQARAILRRLGIPVERRGEPGETTPTNRGPYGGAEAALLERYAGRWVAQDGLEILADGASPTEVVAWLHRNRRVARVWQVPRSPGEVGSTQAAPA